VSLNELVDPIRMLIRNDPEAEFSDDAAGDDGFGSRAVECTFDSVEAEGRVPEVGVVVNSAVQCGWGWG